MNIIYIIRYNQHLTIYGFAIFFDLFKEDYYTKIAINIFLNIISFPFFLIWKNDEYEIVDENVVIP